MTNLTNMSNLSKIPGAEILHNLPTFERPSSTAASDGDTSITNMIQNLGAADGTFID